MDTKSYLAGVFDGEGCIGTGRNHDKNGRVRWFLNVTVCMGSETVVRLFIETWGGNYHVRPKPTVGGLIMHQWHQSASKAIPFLEYVAEHCLVKAEQAKIALELARSMAKYAEQRRAGFNPLLGGRTLSDEDQAHRESLIMQLRALNGARNRFATAAT